jgi:hypothetical protein
MTKSSLAGELRGHLITQGHSAHDLMGRSDDEIIYMVTGACGWSLCIRARILLRIRCHDFLFQMEAPRRINS